MRQVLISILLVSVLSCAQSSETPAASAKLTWDPVPDEEVVGYFIYRSELSGHGYVRVNRDPVADLEFTDVTVEHGKTYYYRVTSVNSDGMESGFSEERSKAIE